MADTIGAITIQRINGFTRQGRRLTIIGDMESEVTMQTLEDLCEDADNGSALHNIPGGQITGEDLTTGSDYTVACTFDDPSVPDDTYLILSPVRRSEDAVTFQNFSLNLFLL